MAIRISRNLDYITAILTPGDLTPNEHQHVTIGNDELALTRYYANALRYFNDTAVSGKLFLLTYSIWTSWARNPKVVNAMVIDQDKLEEYGFAYDQEGECLENIYTGEVFYWDDVYVTPVSIYGNPPRLMLMVKDEDYMIKVHDEDDRKFYLDESLMDDLGVWYCDCCGNYYTGESDSIETRDGDTICQGCYDDYYTCCDECGGIINSENVIHIEDIDAYVCEDCADNYYHYCSNCGHYVSDDAWNDEQECCTDCEEEEDDPEEYGDGDEVETVENSGLTYDDLKYSMEPDGYTSHNKDRMPIKIHGEVFYGERTEFKGGGTELEVDDGTHRDNLIGWLANELKDKAVYKHDGSLHDPGFEIVTNPLVYEDWMAIDWEKITDKILQFGYRSHDTSTCGFHVHISRALLTDEVCEDTYDLRTKTKDATAKIIAFMGYYYKDFMNLSRRHGSTNWANYITPDRYLEESKEDFLERVRRTMYDYNRYMALNLTNSYTVEFRIFKGTLNPSSLRACYDLAYRVAANAKNVKDYTNPAEWLVGINENTKEYLRKRNAFVEYLG